MDYRKDIPAEDAQIMKENLEDTPLGCPKYSINRKCNIIECRHFRTCQILKMTDKEALEFLKSFHLFLSMGRKTGKTLTILRANIAMKRALEALEEKVKKQEQREDFLRSLVESQENEI